MKKTLTTIILITVVLTEASFGATAYIGYNDDTGLFNFSINNYATLIRKDTQITTENGCRAYFGSSLNILSSCEAVVNSNDMTIHFDNYSLVGNAHFTGSLIPSKRIWIPPVEGFGGQDGYWETVYDEPCNYTITYDVWVTSNLPATYFISPTSPFIFDGPNGGATLFLSGELTINGETVAFDIDDIPVTIANSGGHFNDDNYPDSMTMYLHPYYISSPTTIYLGTLGGYSVTIIPEPASLLLFALGGLLIRKR